MNAFQVFWTPIFLQQGQNAARDSSLSWERTPVQATLTQEIETSKPLTLTGIFSCLI